ncbi:MAG: hypothetical protein ACPGJS_06255 [Flammeovirgaceae bacterium]
MLIKQLAPMLRHDTHLSIEFKPDYISINHPNLGHLLEKIHQQVVMTWWEQLTNAHPLFKYYPVPPTCILPQQTSSIPQYCDVTGERTSLNFSIERSPYFKSYLSNGMMLGWKALYLSELAWASASWLPYKHLGGVALWADVPDLFMLCQQTQGQLYLAMTQVECPQEAIFAWYAYYKNSVLHQNNWKERSALVHQQQISWIKLDHQGHDAGVFQHNDVVWGILEYIDYSYQQLKMIFTQLTSHSHIQQQLWEQLFHAKTLLPIITKQLFNLLCNHIHNGRQRTTVDNISEFLSTYELITIQALHPSIRSLALHLGIQLSKQFQKGNWYSISRNIKTHWESIINIHFCSTQENLQSIGCRLNVRYLTLDHLHLCRTEFLQLKYWMEVNCYLDLIQAINQQEFFFEELPQN